MRSQCAPACDTRCRRWRQSRAPDPLAVCSHQDRWSGHTLRAQTQTRQLQRQASVWTWAPHEKGQHEIEFMLAGTSAHDVAFDFTKALSVGAFRFVVVELLC